jgi:hypothetical protein
MSDEPDSASKPPAANVENLLTTAVKSAILDRLISDLRGQASLGSAQSSYTKSDSGLYGKYQKADTTELALLEAIETALSKLVNESDVSHTADHPADDRGRAAKGSKTGGRT